MRRFLRRLLVIFVAVVLGLIAVGLFALHMARAAPGWYQPAEWSPEELAIAANEADQKMIDSLNWATDVQAHRARLRYAAEHGSTLPATDLPPAPKTVSFTEEQINASFQKWLIARPDIANAIGQYAANVRLVFGQGRLILAGQLLRLGGVVSVQIEPSIDANGNLRARLAQVDIGTLPMPRVLFGSQFDLARNALAGGLPSWQKKAAFDSDGCANPSAVSAAMAKLALAMLDDQAAEPIGFLPSLSDRGKPIAVRITAIAISPDGMSITFEAPGDSERNDLLEQIRMPYGAPPDATQPAPTTP
jgi:hypothetical protein